MKKLISILVIACIVVVVSAQTTTPRYTTPTSNDNTGRALNYKYAHTTTTNSTATLYQIPNAYYTLYKIDTLKHALTDSLGVTKSYCGDQVVFMFAADTLTAGRVVTFGTHIKCAGTLTVGKSKSATASFIFNGVQWIEQKRAINTN
jgi:hypothetical protein